MWLYFIRLEPRKRRASDGPRVARRSEEEVLYLPPPHRRHHRGEDLPTAGTQESPQLLRRRPRGGCAGQNEMFQETLRFISPTL